MEGDVQGAAAMGASAEQIGSWMWALGLGMAITCIGLSLRWRTPVVTAWSTPGAALIAATRAGQAWIPPDELRDGATVAHLASGDAPGARRVFAWLAPYSRRGPADFRSTLLLSYLDTWRGK